MKLIDLSYYYSADCSNPEVLLQRQASAIPYAHYLPEGCHASVVKFLDYEGHIRIEAVDYYFSPGLSSPFWIPQQAQRLIRDLQPDVVLLHSLLYSRQVVALRRALGSQVTLLVQHHAEQPGSWWQVVLQRRADACIDGYLFAAQDLALPWLRRGVISDRAKVFTAPEGSTSFSLRNKEEARGITRMQGTPSFLWVGRLDANKDPLTALQAFYHYALQHKEARLYMIYQAEDLLPEVQHFIYQQGLQEQVVLVGKRLHEEMEAWYNSADYYLSTSHGESYGFSLVEAMACGCIPIVTDIPSFRSIVSKGTLCHLFQPGDVQGLYEQLCRLPPATLERREQVAAYFQQHLSFRAMATTIHNVCQQLIRVELHEPAG